MDWYHALVVGDNDIRLKKNSLTMNRLDNDAVVGNVVYYVSEKKFIPEQYHKVGSRVWIMTPDGMHQNKRYFHAEIKSVNDDSVMITKVTDSEYPSLVHFNSDHIWFSWTSKRIGPVAVTLYHDRRVICHFDFGNDDTPKRRISISIDVKPNKYIDPFDTEFCKDDVTRIKLASLLRGNDFGVYQKLEDFLNELV